MKVMLQDVRVEAQQEEFFEGQYGGRRFALYGPQVVRLTMTAVVDASEFEKFVSSMSSMFSLCELRPVQMEEGDSDAATKALLEYGRRKIMK